MSMRCNAVRGTDLPQAKLNEDDVILIRALVMERNRLISEARKLTDKKISEKFGIHPNTVWKLTKYGSWKHV